MPNPCRTLFDGKPSKIGSLRSRQRPLPPSAANYARPNQPRTGNKGHKARKLGAIGAFFLYIVGAIGVYGLMAVRPITVAETALFVRQADDVWDIAERGEFVDFIARNPEAGSIIPETGGVRKLRWRRQVSAREAEFGSFISITTPIARFTC
jgi:hypothetical protein